MDLEQYKKLAFKNNTFEIKALEESLNDSKMNAYQYLRNFQFESTGYRRFDFNMQDIYRTNKVNHVWSYVPRRWLFFIDYEFINVGKRLDYKRSKLFEKDLDYNDVANNPNLFDSSFLVFVNGKLYTEGVKILCKEDKTYIIFICKEKPSDIGFTIQEMLDYLENNAQVTIFFIPNVGITNINTNAYRLRSNAAYKGLQYRHLNLSENAVYDENTLTYAKYNGETVSRPINVTFGESGLFVDEESIQRSIDMDKKNTSMNIQLIPLRYLFEKVNIGKGNKWFKLPLQDYPISSENCLVFDVDGNFIHSARVKHYYPNVYSVEDVDDIVNERELVVYTFYYLDKHSVLKHKNIIEVYHKYMPDYLERYQKGLIPKELLEFEPPVVNYSIKDFKLFNSADSHFVYKVEKMKEFIRADVNNFRNYLRKLHVHNNYYYVDVSKIELSERLRTNNSECGVSYKEFENEMYMFVFRNDFRSMYDKLLIHIDGLRYETVEIYSNESFDFVYIPKDIVTDETVIEIENEIVTEDLIKDEELIVTCTSEGNIKSVSIAEYNKQKRNGKGNKGADTKEDEVVVDLFAVNSKDDLLFITNKGRCHTIKAYKIPKTTRTGKGRNLANFITLDEDEWPVKTLATNLSDKSKSIMMITNTGVVKKLAVSQLSAKFNVTKIIGLTDEVEVIDATLVEENDDIMIATAQGMSLRFSCDAVRPMGRSARGVKGIKLEEDDVVVALTRVYPDANIVTIAENGVGKATNESEFSPKSRGCKGIKCHKINNKTGALIACFTLDKDNVLIGTANNKLIRIDSDSIAFSSRVTAGNKLINLDQGDTVVAAACLPEEEIEKEE